MLPWTRNLWIYDFRTNQSLTLKERPLRGEHLDDFVAVSRLAERYARQETDRFRRFGYGERSNETSSTSHLLAQGRESG
jgi:type I restriction enzyme M protein